jgi:hypothetical protein
MYLMVVIAYCAGLALGNRKKGKILPTTLLQQY